MLPDCAVHRANQPCADGKSSMPSSARRAAVRGILYASSGMPVALAIRTTALKMATTAALSTRAALPRRVFPWWRACARWVSFVPRTVPQRSPARQGRAENRLSRRDSAPASEEPLHPDGLRHTACARGRSSRVSRAGVALGALCGLSGAGSQERRLTAAEPLASPSQASAVGCAGCGLLR